MFTGIVQAVAVIAAIDDRTGLRSFSIDFPPGFCEGLAIGASVAVDGVCLTVTRIASPVRASFDVMQQSLAVTTLGRYAVGTRVNVERAAREGAEIGGHPLSGHVDCVGELIAVRAQENNLVWRIAVPPSHRRYVFARGYIAVHGASLTIAECDRVAGWFEVWLIPRRAAPRCSKASARATRSTSKSSAARRSWSIPCATPWPSSSGRSSRCSTNGWPSMGARSMSWRPTCRAEPAFAVGGARLILRVCRRSA